jgi:hypothetical protein
VLRRLPYEWAAEAPPHQIALSYATLELEDEQRTPPPPADDPLARAAAQVAAHDQAVGLTRPDG